jgi:hypothetical protein
MSPEASATAPKPSKAPALPIGQLELATLAEAAAVAWAASALPALLWCPKAQLGTMAAAYKASISTADAAGDPLSTTAQRLTELDKELDASLKFVKNYLLEAFGKDGAKARYDEFGIKPNGKLPTARPARSASLTKLLAALLTYKLGTNKYGTAYWQPLATEYAKLAQGSSATRQNASGQVGTKNSQEKPLRKVLRALKLSIRANFPDTFGAELRRFGFLAESF